MSAGWHPGAARRRRPRRQSHPPSELPRGWRVFLAACGWLFVLIGIFGLALPGIQGVLTLALGAALLAVASGTAYQALRWTFGRWPRGWRRVERMRRRIHRRIVARPPRVD